MVNAGNNFIWIRSASLCSAQMEENVGQIYWSDLTSKEIPAKIIHGL